MVKKRNQTWIPSISASWARNKVIWLVRLNGAVSQRPGGTLSCAPPLFPNLEMAEIALSKASVFTVTPSPRAPKSVRLNATGLSLGNGFPRLTPRPNTKNPSTMFLCQTKTEANATIHSTTNSVLCDVNRDTNALWFCNRPSVAVKLSTIVVVSSVSFSILIWLSWASA